MKIEEVLCLRIGAFEVGLDAVKKKIQKFNSCHSEESGKFCSGKKLGVGDKVQMKGSPKLRGRIVRVSQDGYAQLDTNKRIHLDLLEPQVSIKRGPSPPNFGDKRSAVPDSKGKSHKNK